MSCCGFFFVFLGWGVGGCPVPRLPGSQVLGVKANEGKAKDVFLGVGWGNFESFFDHFSCSYQHHATTHAPCDVPSCVLMPIGC